MAAQQIVPIAEHYFNRHRFCDAFLHEAPSANMGMTVVIPCANETSISGVLQSVLACSETGVSVEVIVVINAAENAPASFLDRNNAIEKYLSDIVVGREDITVHTITINDLPAKIAGVGLARKIGLDEALQRYAAIGRDGLLICLDADCCVDPGYLKSIWRYFNNHPEHAGCSIYFEHPIESGDLVIDRAIAEYELHLRLYRYGLQSAHLPFAFHTVGSSMAFRASAYARHGGMNKRKAGEDFYFLQKLIKTGRFGNCLDTCVHPASRVASLLPFGTATSIKKILAGSDGGTYHPDVYKALNDLRDIAHFLTEKSFESLPLTPVMKRFLRHHHAERELEMIRNNVRGEKLFVKRFFRWFDAFMALKFAHYFTGHVHDKIPVEAACKAFPISSGDGTADLLKTFRDLDGSAEIATLAEQYNREIYA